MAKKKVQLMFPVSTHNLDMLQKCIFDLSRWYCDELTIKKKDEEEYIFTWNGATAADTTQEVAYLRQKEDLCISFYKQEDNHKSKYYFELKIESNETIEGVHLIITEFVDEQEEEECKTFWEAQIEKLNKILGSA